MTNTLRALFVCDITSLDHGTYPLLLWSTLASWVYQLRDERLLWLTLVLLHLLENLVDNLRDRGVRHEKCVMRCFLTLKI